MSVQKDKLMEMLSGAKQVMDKVDKGDYKVNSDMVNRKMNQSEELLDSLPPGAVPQQRQPQPTHQPQPTSQSQQTQTQGSYRNLNTSKMPDNIKEAMINNPIPKMEMNPNGQNSFSLEDVQELLNQNQGQRNPEPQSQPQQMQVNESQITNSSGQRLITMTEAELDKKIDDALMNFMSKTFTKNLTENTIKKTITTLIKEGKLKVKSKTK